MNLPVLIRITRRKVRPAVAFTLIEMVVSLSVVSIIFLAMGSVMLMSAKAIPTSSDPSVQTFESMDAIRQLTTELQTATVIAAATDRSIAFKIPDRDGNGQEEMLAYFWSNSPGAPLVRIYNGGASVSVIPNVQSFSLEYDIRSVPQPDILEDGSEVLLDSFDTATTEADFTVTSTNWMGQLITPRGAPADAVSWNINRVMFQPRRSSSDRGKISVQIRPTAPEGTPDATVIESHEMLESSMDSNYLWETVNYSRVRGLSPSEKVCLVMQWMEDDQACDIRCATAGGSGFMLTNTGGASWGAIPNISLYYYVYGTYTTSVPQPPIEVLQAITVNVNPGTDPGTEVRSRVTALNQPEMP